MPRRNERHYAALGGLVLALFICGPSLSQQVQRAPEAQLATATPENSSAQEPRAANVGAARQPTPPSRHAESGGEDSRIELGTWPDWVIVGFTLVLTVVAMLQHRLEAKMGQETADSIKIARDSAAAAHRSADVAERNLTMVQAAYVFMEDLRIAKHVNNETGELTTVTFAPLWRNSGHTPTRFLFNWVSIDFRLGQLPSDFPFPDQGNLELQRLYIGPQSAITGGLVALEADDLTGIGPGWSVTVWGWAEYNDTFANTPRHRSEFAVSIEFLDTPSKVDTQILWRFYKRHNGSEAECVNQLRTNADGLLAR